MEKRSLAEDGKTVVIRRRRSVLSGSSLGMSAVLNALCPPKVKNIQRSPNCGGSDRKDRRYRNGK